MKVQTFDKPRVEEKTLRLKLQDNIFGTGTTLRAVHANGLDVFCGNIVRISQDGVTRCPDVSKECGLPLDGEGQVKVNDMVPSDVLAMLTPIVRFAEAYARRFPHAYGIDTVVACNGHAVTKGDFDRLDRFFKANK